MDATSLSLIIVALINTAGLVLIARMNRNIQKIETATNSMKDALVAKTDSAARAEGQLQGRADQLADIAKGTQ